MIRKLVNVNYRISLHSIKLSSSPENVNNTAVILHHGLLGSGRNFRPLLHSSHLLKFNDFLLPDSRNHGQSPHTSNHSIQALAEDLHEYIIEQKKIYENFILVGHSMGGLAVLEFMRKYPEMNGVVSRCVVVDAPCKTKRIYGSSWGVEEDSQMLKYVSRMDLKRETKLIWRQLQDLCGDKGRSDLYKFNLKFDGGKDSHRWLANVGVLASSFDKFVHYSLEGCQWKGPVEVIFGSESDYFTQQQIQCFVEQFPQMTSQNFHEIEGAGHWVHFDRKQQFLKVLDKIINRK